MTDPMFKLEVDCGRQVWTFDEKPFLTRAKKSGSKRSRSRGESKRSGGREARRAVKGRKSVKVPRFSPEFSVERSGSFGISTDEPGQPAADEIDWDKYEEARQAYAFDPQHNANSSDLVYRLPTLEKNYKPWKPLSDESKGVKLSSKITGRTEKTRLTQLGRQSVEQLCQLSKHRVRKAINFYRALQAEDGHWPGDYGGPMFLLPGALVTCYVSGTPLAEWRQREMRRYLFNQQHEDGGWGIHIEERSTMFGSALSYISLRLLGVSADHPRLVLARHFIRELGGVVGTPSWGKFWMCVLGVYDWQGVNSLFPELWIAPESLPVAPWRYWCHCRMVYLPMAYAYGHKITGPLTDLVKDLREELYPLDAPYTRVCWSKWRDYVTKVDRYFHGNLLLDMLNLVTNTYEKVHSSSLRRRSCDWILEYIHAEDVQTNHICIGPVNKFVNMLAVWHGDGAKSKRFRKHQGRVVDYLWLAEDGMKCQGYNGSQLWDCAFAVQAMVTSGEASLFVPTMQEAYKFIECAQVMVDEKNKERYYRHISKGAWPFSTRAHGWPISDCTAEGLKATLLLHGAHGSDIDLTVGGERKMVAKTPVIEDQRLFDAVNVILSFQNKDGGWATYENTRGSPLLEWINPSEVFGAIMIDYSYVECTSACLQALQTFKEQYPEHRAREVFQAIRGGIKFIRDIQCKDGSWYGSWGVCFTYGTWFGIWGLLATGAEKDDPAVVRACEFLLSKQREDGGWGESYKSSADHEYRENDSAQVVNTAWAILGLMAADTGAYTDAIRKGVCLLLSRQQDNGDWLQESISGVFNGNCMISYTSYRNVFPIWALGMFKQQYGDE